MTKRFLITIGIMGAISVLMGAVGAHILEGNISDKYLNMFNTANEFLMYHALALIGLTAMNRYVSRSYLNAIYFLFVIGIIFFSGTLYITSLTELTDFRLGLSGTLTPIGGILLIIGWIAVVLSGVTYKHKKRHSEN
ncbi:MAG: DUF423 domain-containing protein [Bacteroidetes bacterium]|nr:DUF423 domain-containing protein [Bacteroidota bacterium]